MNNEHEAELGKRNINENFCCNDPALSHCPSPSSFFFSSSCFISVYKRSLFIEFSSDGLGHNSTN